MSQFTDMFKGLMFLHGHIVHPEDGTTPPALGNRAASERWFAAHGGESKHAAKQELSAIEHLSFLGGRPMHAGCNFDRDELFEQLGEAANDEAELAACATC